jgi:hypothetical protein
LRDLALKALELGINPLPPKQNGSKAPKTIVTGHDADGKPINEWKPFQQRQATRDEIRRWYGPSTGFGVVCGAISGHLELFEFDDETTYVAFKAKAHEVGLGDLVDRIEAGYLEKTPGGGRHWFYRADTSRPNTPLASRHKTEDELTADDLAHIDAGTVVWPQRRLIETRGEGGFAVTWPTSGNVHPTGKPYSLLSGGFETIAKITDGQREGLWKLARSFDQMEQDRDPEPRYQPEDRPQRPGEDLRPGTDFNNKVAADPTLWHSMILGPHGYTFAYTRNGVDYVGRPGKKKGAVSATINYSGRYTLKPFSTSMYPFEVGPGITYTPFCAYTLLNHGGDFSAAGKDLYRKGFGDHRPAAAPPQDDEGVRRERFQDGTPSDLHAGQSHGAPTATRVYLFRKHSDLELARSIWLTASMISGRDGDDLRFLEGKEAIFVSSPGERWPGKVTFNALADLKPRPIVKRLLMRESVDGVTTFADWLERRDARLPEDIKREIDGLVDAAEAVDRDGRPPFRLQVYGAIEFNATAFKQTWLIKKILVEGQPAGLGGPKKSLKTSIALDAAVSLASGTSFLGQFEVPRRVRTLVLTGESGGFVTQETVRRICASKGITPDELEGYFFIGFTLPNLSDDDHMDKLAQFIWDHKIEVVIIDPIFLCLLKGLSNGKKIDAGNVFDMGPLLQEVGQTCLDAGATPVLVHHFKKTAPDPFVPPDLDDFAYSGMPEYIRQWILVRRRERYVPGSGAHKVWLVAGGSAGHAGEWAVDINEGTIDEHFKGRGWGVKVSYPSEERAMTEEQAKLKAREREDEKRQAADVKADKRVGEDAEKVRLAMVEIGGAASKTDIRDNTTLNSDRFNKALAMLMRYGQVREVVVRVKSGRGGKGGTDNVGYELTGKGPQVD